MAPETSPRMAAEAKAFITMAKQENKKKQDNEDAHKYENVLMTMLEK